MRTHGLFGLIAVAGLAGCAAMDEMPADDFSGFVGVDEKSDAFSLKIKIVGTLVPGDVSPATPYHNPPRYLAYKFAAESGDDVSIWVRSQDGDAVAWLLDSSFKAMAKNDNGAVGTADSHLQVTLPSSDTYYVMFREKSLADATFTVEVDGAHVAQPDGGGGGGGSPDMGGGGKGSPDMGGGGAVGPTGGTVNLLHFGLTGDTRPPGCGGTANYPTAVINNIADHFKAESAQFALDLGDHMFVCNNDLTAATTQMGYYMTATKRFPNTWFMTMGNHECTGGPCMPGSQNANYLAFTKALAPISQLPYYSFDVHTSKGLATFVIIADNAWSSAQATWLEQTMAKADTDATYTIVARHHPSGDSSVATNATSMQIVRGHKFSLFLTGHSHLYKHMTTDAGRDLVLGTGGAPLVAGGAFYGYAMVDQQPSGQLTVTVHDLNANSTVDTWSVNPN